MHRSMFYVAPIAFLSLHVAACGGKVGDDSGRSIPTSSVPSSSEAEKADEQLLPPGPTDGSWGTWQLLSLDAPTPDGPRNYDPPFVEIDLHPDGKAYRWTCADAEHGGSGERCPANRRQGCMVGTVQLEGLVWRVQLHNREGTQVVARADIEEEPSGDIRMHGDGALHPNAHYRRVSAASRERCVP